MSSTAAFVAGYTVPAAKADDDNNNQNIKLWEKAVLLSRL